MSSLAIRYVLLFAAALLANGALLAFVEPVALKILLPQLVCSPPDRSTCSAFFPVLSLLGYAYAHATIRMLGVRRQVILHLGLLVLPLVWWGLGQAGFVPPALLFDPEGQPHPSETRPWQVALWVSGRLLATVGVPLFALTACVPLLQRWFAETGHPQARDPYFLYASGCLGSLAMLLTYPFLVEPLFSVAEQEQGWLLGSVLCVALTAGCALLLWKSASSFPPEPRPEEAAAAAPVQPIPRAELLWPPAAAAVLRRLHWIALAAVPFGLAATLANYISTEVSAIPLFWLVPLLLVQFTRLLAFARQPLFASLSRRTRRALQLAHALALVACLLALLPSQPADAGAHARPLTNVAWLILVPLMLLTPQALAVVLQPVTALLVVFGELTGIWALPQLALHLLAVFMVMRCCHGALARDRPPPHGLTGYFLCIAAGDALGWLFAAVLAPMLFPADVAEYWLALVLACLLRPASARNGLSDRLIVRGLCGLGHAGAATARLTRLVVALVLDWLYPLLLGVLTVELWVHREQVRPLLTTLGVEGPVVRDALLCGLPLLLCLLTVARRVRFGLSLGAVLLAKSLAPTDPERAAITLLGGLPDSGSVALALLLLPGALGAVVVLTGLLSMVLVGDKKAPAPAGSFSDA